MLRKLMKYEWRATYKIMVAVNLTLILLTLAGCVFLNTDIFGREDTFPVAILLLALYALSLVASGIVTLLYLYVRFYQNLFAAEGYFMHTLPVTPMQLLHSKLVVGYVWTVLNSALTTLSIFALLAAIFFRYGQLQGVESLFKLLYGGTGTATLRGKEILDPFYGQLGYHVGNFFSKFLLLHLVSSFASLLTGYASILLGQLVEKYKRMASVGFYIALYLVNQTVCSILMVAPTMQSLSENTGIFASRYFRAIMDYGIASQLIMGAVFYVGTVFLMHRKVNLD